MIKLVAIIVVSLILLIIAIRSLVRWTTKGYYSNGLMEQAKKATTWLSGCVKAIGKIFGAKDERC